MNTLKFAFIVAITMILSGCGRKDPDRTPVTQVNEPPPAAAGTNPVPAR